MHKVFQFFIPVILFSLPVVRASTSLSGKSNVLVAAFTECKSSLEAERGLASKPGSKKEIMMRTMVENRIVSLTFSDSGNPKRFTVEDRFNYSDSKDQDTPFPSKPVSIYFHESPKKDHVVIVIKRKFNDHFQEFKTLNVANLLTGEPSLVKKNGEFTVRHEAEFKVGNWEGFLEGKPVEFRVVADDQQAKFHPKIVSTITNSSYVPLGLTEVSIYTGLKIVSELRKQYGSSFSNVGESQWSGKAEIFKGTREKMEICGPQNRCIIEFELPHQ